MSLERSTLIPALKNIATRLRIDSVKSTSQAGSGHPTSCCSAAELVAAVQAVSRGLIVIDPQIAGIAGLRWNGAPAPIDPVDDLLTPREMEVLRLVANGLPNKTIAHQLEISEHTVKFHVGSILTKLDAASRTEAVTIATRRGLLAV